MSDKKSTSRRSARLSNPISKPVTRPKDPHTNTLSPPKQVKRCQNLNHCSALDAICCNCGTFISPAPLAKISKRKYKFLSECTLSGMSLRDRVLKLQLDTAFLDQSNVLCNTCFSYLLNEKRLNNFKTKTVKFSLCDDLIDCLVCKVFESKSSFTEVYTSLSVAQEESMKKLKVSDTILPRSDFDWDIRCKNCLVQYKQGAKHDCSKKMKVENLFKMTTLAEQQTFVKRFLAGNFGKSGSFEVFGVGRPMKLKNSVVWVSFGSGNLIFFILVGRLVFFFCYQPSYPITKNT